MEKTKISSNLRDNEAYIRKRCKNCADILIRPMRLGDGPRVDCLMVYIEVAVSNMMLDDSAIGKMVNHFWEISPEQIQDFIRNNSLGIADVKKLPDMEAAFGALLAGNAVFFMDGCNQAMKIASKGYPNMGVSGVETEKVLRGSREGFSDAVKVNSALVRKRIRDTRLKVEERTVGIRSQTMVQILYIEDLVREDLLEEVKKPSGRVRDRRNTGQRDAGTVDRRNLVFSFSPVSDYRTSGQSGAGTSERENRGDLRQFPLRFDTSQFF